MYPVHRCKVTADLTLAGRTTCTAQCEKCNASINAGFRPCMLHHYSDVLGYLDLHNATAADLVLQECELIMGCLACSQDFPVQVLLHEFFVRESEHHERKVNSVSEICLFFVFQNISYGQTKEFNCEHCHSKLSIQIESTRFQYIQPRTNKTGQSLITIICYERRSLKVYSQVPESVVLIVIYLKCNTMNENLEISTRFNVFYFLQLQVLLITRQ